MRSHKGTHFAAAPPILLLIPNTPSIVFGTTTAPINMENVEIYSAVAVSVYIDIVYK